MQTQPVLTYLANTIRTSGGREVPYSLVTAVDLRAIAVDVAVAVGEGVPVAVAVAVGVAVPVGLAVADEEAVAVAVAAVVGVAVSVGVGEGVPVGVGEGVAVSVAAGVAVAVSVGVAGGVAAGVGEAVAVNVCVGVAVGVCVGEAVGVGAALGVAVGLAVAADAYVRKNRSKPAGLVSSYGNDSRENMPPPGYGSDGPSPRRGEPVVTMRAYFVPVVTATGAGRSMWFSPGFTTASPVDPSRVLVANSRSSTTAVLGVWK